MDELECTLEGDAGVACCDCCCCWKWDVMRLRDARRMLNLLVDRRSDSDVSGV
jgi:hypothetical protein